MCIRDRSRLSGFPAKITKEAKNFSVSNKINGIMVVNGYIVTLFFEKEKRNMKRILTTYPIISTLALICLLLGLLTSFYGDAMYDLLAFHSKPVYGWQYVSGSLMHGSKGCLLYTSLSVNRFVFKSHFLFIGGFFMCSKNIHTCSLPYGHKGRSKSRNGY